MVRTSAGLHHYDIVFNNRFSEVGLLQGYRALQQIESEVCEIAARVADDLVPEAPDDFDEETDPWMDTYLGVQDSVHRGIEAGYLLVKSLREQ